MVGRWRDGVILYSADGGFQWTSQHTRLVVNLNGLYVQDPKRAVVVGARGTVVITKNGGVRWTEIRAPTKDHLFSITFAPDSPTHGWAWVLTVASSRRMTAG